MLLEKSGEIEGFKWLGQGSSDAQLWVCLAVKLKV